MPRANQLGGIVHSYQKYDPREPSQPSQSEPDLVSSAFEHMLAYGDLREYSAEELAEAIRIDPSQIAGLGPNLRALLAMLMERKEKLLATYEGQTVARAAEKQYQDLGSSIQVPKSLRQLFSRAFRGQQPRDLEIAAHLARGEGLRAADDMDELRQALSHKLLIDLLNSQYELRGQTRLNIPQAIDLLEELQTLDRLIRQLEEALKNAKLAIIDLEALSEYADPEQLNSLRELQDRLQEYMKDLADRQGLEATKRGYRLTPKAYRIFQGKLLSRIFSELQASRTGRHQNAVQGEGAVELAATKDYEFGDAVSGMDIPASLINALVREPGQSPIRFRTDDLVIHKTRNTPKCATVVCMDMSGSMRYGGQYVQVKRMALALDGLIKSEYPGDVVRFIEMYTLAKLRQPSEIVSLLPKLATIHDPIVRLRADMSNPNISERHLPPHFTNIQHALRLSRQLLSVQDTPNRQIILITDGLPTAHFEESLLYLLYPPDDLTQQATLKEGLLAAREGITINVFLLQSWSQSEEDVRFVQQLAKSTSGRVFFPAGRELERFVVWDYVTRRRQIIG